MTDSNRWPTPNERMSALLDHLDHAIRPLRDLEYPTDKFEPWDKPTRKNRPGFWPGASGLHPKNLAGDVLRPGGIIVLGHNWGSRKYYEETEARAEPVASVASRRVGNVRLAPGGPTGHHLDNLAAEAGIDLKGAFFTNALIGLKKGQWPAALA
jgi:hypothetical protein